MRIKDECVRDILLTIEEKSTFKNPCRMIGYKKYPLLEKYESDELFYHLRYLKNKHFLFTPDNRDEDSFDLTPEGHDFLNTIREQ